MRMRTRPQIVETELDRPVEEVEVMESHSRYSPAQFIHAAIGTFLLVIGVIAMVRGDLSGDLTASTFDVLGITHSAAIGIGEVVAGALLLLAATGAGGRVLGVMVGIALVVFGAVLLSDDGTVQDLGTETALGWLVIVLGGAAALAGLMPERRVRRRTVDRSTLG